jgi:hypothetical protein
MKNIKTTLIAIILTFSFIYACFYALDKGLARQEQFTGCTTDAICEQLNK